MNPPSLSPGRLFTLTTAYPVQNIDVSYPLNGEGNFSDGYMCTLIETDSEACDNTTCIQQARCQGRGELLVPDKAFVNLSLRLQLPIPEDEEGDEESTSNNPVCYGSVQVLVQMHIFHSADAQPLCNCVVTQPYIIFGTVHPEILGNRL